MVSSVRSFCLILQASRNHGKGLHIAEVNESKTREKLGKNSRQASQKEIRG